MIYSVSDDVPEYWIPIVDTFITVVEHDVEFNKGVPIDSVNCFIRHGQLMITYSGGSKITDAFAAFAAEMSSQICYECGQPATRFKFELPKCDSCD